MYNSGKSTLAYMCYPYSRDPQGTTKESRVIACAIMKKHPNIFIILPHTAVDMTLFGTDFVGESGKEHKIQDHLDAETCEYVILDKIELFIIGTEREDMSSGMTWEYSYVSKNNREGKTDVDVKYAKGELLSNREYEKCLKEVKKATS